MTSVSYKHDEWTHCHYNLKTDDLHRKAHELGHKDVIVKKAIKW